MRDTRTRTSCAVRYIKAQFPFLSAALWVIQQLNTLTVILGDHDQHVPRPPLLDEESIRVELQKRPAGILPDSAPYKLYRLSEQNKQSLLKEAIGDKRKSEDEGRKLVERLCHFDQSFARDFGLRSEAVLNAPFKLLFKYCWLSIGSGGLTLI